MLFQRRQRTEAKSESKMEMTPMIDVTFLLLIFFLCTVKFKVLEGKIPAFLPKDVGVNQHPTSVQLEKIEIDVSRVKTANVTDKAWVWDESQIAIEINGRRLQGLKEFHDLISRVHAATPDLKATLHPLEGTLYIDTVKVVNECLRCNFTALTFGGVAMDS